MPEIHSSLENGEREREREREREIHGYGFCGVLAPITALKFWALIPSHLASEGEKMPRGAALTQVPLQRRKNWKVHVVFRPKVSRYLSCTPSYVHVHKSAKVVAILSCEIKSGKVRGPRNIDVVHEKQNGRRRR